MDNKYTIKSYNKVGVKTKKFGLVIDDFIIFIRVSAYSIAGLGVLKMVLPIPSFTFLIFLGLLTLFYLFLRNGNKNGKDYFLYSRYSRFFMQYRKLTVKSPRELVQKK